MEEIFVSLPNPFVKKIIIEWMNYNIQIVAQLSKFNSQNKYNQQIEKNYN